MVMKGVDSESKHLDSQAEVQPQVLVVPVAHGEGAQVAKGPDRVMKMIHQRIPSSQSTAGDLISQWEWQQEVQ